MPDIKTYEPEVIQENPLPIHEGDTFNVSQSTSNDTYSPQTINDQPFPKKLVAQETIASTLNTKSRKILGSYEFTNKGAIQIGKYENGVSGDLKLSPDGIVARNSGGTTTFAIDGTTGDAVFKGSVQSGTLITGQVIVGGGRIIIDGSENGTITIRDDNNVTIIDAQGLVSTANFVNGSITDTTTRTTTSNSFVDVDAIACSVTFTIDREQEIFVTFDATGFNTDNLAGSDNCIATINVNGTDQAKQVSLAGTLTGDGSLFGVTGSLTFLLTLGAGTHTIKGRFRRNNAGTATIVNTSITYIKLGD